MLPCRFGDKTLYSALETLNLSMRSRVKAELLAYKSDFLQVCSVLLSCVSKNVRSLPPGNSGVSR